MLEGGYVQDNGSGAATRHRLCLPHFFFFYSALRGWNAWKEHAVAHQNRARFLEQSEDSSEKQHFVVAAGTRCPLSLFLERA